MRDPNDAPQELVDLIIQAMIAHGPEGHCDGAYIIADIVWEWLATQNSAQTTAVSNEHWDRKYWKDRNY